MCVCVRVRVRVCVLGGVRELTSEVGAVLRAEVGKFTSATGEEAKTRGNLAFKEARSVRSN